MSNEPAVYRADHSSHWMRREYWYRVIRQRCPELRSWHIGPVTEFLATTKATPDQPLFTVLYAAGILDMRIQYVNVILTFMQRNM